MVSPSLVIHASFLAQAGGAVLLAMLLLAFHRHYQRNYLLTWAWSWWASCVSLLGAAIALYLSLHAPDAALARSVASSLSLVGGYWQVALLLFGLQEVATGSGFSRRFRWGVLAVLAALGLLSVVASLGLESQARLLVRVGFKGLLQGGALLVAGALLWPGRLRSTGRRTLSIGFVLSGLHQLHYVLILAAPSLGLRMTNYGPYMTPFDFLFLMVIGIGMVAWLLEDERQRVVAAKAELEHLASYDRLTGLPNRYSLVRDLAAQIARAKAGDERLAVCFLDLDRFNKVNGSFGNDSGDEVLKRVADRLRNGLGSSCMVSRIAADEFAAVFPLTEPEVTADETAEKLLALTRLPFTLRRREVFLTASLGISRFPEDGDDPEVLLRCAEIAMYRAKETRRDSHQAYAPDLNPDSLEQLSLEGDLRRALAQDRGELILFYQPITDSQLRIRSVEALLRWRHPERGLLGPRAFLWLAGVSELASDIDDWVLHTACREIQQWRLDGADLQLAVNLSPRTFDKPELLPRVEEVLAETGLPPSALVLEITETTAMRNAGATLAALRRLKELGVNIAIDDFGTGFSSLSYLTTLPIDTLKVDRSFVRAVGKERDGEEVAAAVIALGLSLGLGVIAEGVEKEEQWRWLESRGCRKFQGFLFSRPLPAARCRELALRGSLGPPTPVQDLSDTAVGMGRGQAARGLT